MLEPRLPENWLALHVGTGEFVGALGHYSELGEYARRFGYKDLNINVDPKAAAYVLDRGGDFILYPNEIMDDASLYKRHRDELKESPSPLAKWVASEMTPYAPIIAAIGAVTGAGKGMPLHGVIPAAAALDPTLAEPPAELRFKMEYGKKGGYRFVITDDPEVPKRKVYAKLADPEELEKRLVERLK